MEQAIQMQCLRFTEVDWYQADKWNREEKQEIELITEKDHLHDK